jgi:drug/metabolite transporter superfamily protein YnfA
MRAHLVAVGALSPAEIEDMHALLVSQAIAQALAALGRFATTSSAYVRPAEWVNEDLPPVRRHRIGRDHRLLFALPLAQAGPVDWLLLPAAASLALFAWLLTWHATAAGRVYAAYGGVYAGVALAWLWAVDKVQPTPYDVAGSWGAILVGLGLKCVRRAPLHIRRTYVRS